ncbi:MAG: Ig-like domain-containing protein [Myxococcales bacterium]
MNPRNQSRTWQRFASLGLLLLAACPINARTPVVAVTPETATVAPGGTVQFSAEVSGATDSTVLWSVEESGGGTVSSNGLYSAPSTEGTYHVLAISKEDSKAQARATVTVKAAAPQVAVAVSPKTAALQVGTSQQFAATVTGTSNTAVTWSVQEAQGGTVSTTGFYTAPSIAGTFHVVATSVADATRFDLATVTVTTAPPPVAVAVSPKVAALQVGASQQFNATVSGTSDTTVTWKVEEAGGGSVSAAGLYTAPAVAGTFHLVATSVADATKSDAATITVTTAPPPVTVTVSPKPASVKAGEVQQFTATVTGADDTAVTWSVQEAGGGTVSGTGLYVAPSAAGTYHVVATSVADATKSDSATVTVTAAPQNVTVTITPKTAALGLGGTQQFSASVTGASNTAVTWKVQETSGGTVNSSGLYQAPNAAGTYHVVATSAADTAKSDSATVTVARSGADTAQHNFEAGTQGWVPSTGGWIGGVATTTSTVFAGNQALQVNFAGGTAGERQQVGVASPVPGPGDLVTYHVWIPSGSAIARVQPFVLEGAAGNWRWTGTVVEVASLQTNAWNTLSVTVPADATTPLYGIGVEFTASGPWTGTAYVDSIGWTSCQKTTCAAQGKNCGSLDDGCGGTLACGTCTGNNTCVANVCTACSPTTCTAQGKNCGTISDGCNGTLTCGSCSGNDVCTSNVCTACTPTTCAAQGKNCGTLSDGCNGTLPCGSCSGAETCGGGGVANVCGDPGSVYQLPADRSTQWKPGVTGGIPNYATVHTTVNHASGDMRTPIQNALNAAGAAASATSGRVVQLGPGVFTISGTLVIPSYVVLRGSGVDASGNFQTQLKSGGPGFTLVRIGSVSPAGEQSVNLASDAAKGATSVTLASSATSAGFAAGQLVWADELTDGVISKWNTGTYPNGSDSRGWYSRWDRPIGQVLEVASVSGNTVTFKTPLHIGLRTSQTAQLTHYSDSPTRGAGVEELRVTTGYDGVSQYGYDQSNLKFGFAVDCWAKHFEADGSAGQSVGFRIAHHCEAREGYVHDTQYYQNGGWGYGFDLTHGSSDNLIEDCISIRFNKVINMRASGGGNVVGYNYMDDGAISWNEGWIETGLQASHHPTPHYELFEGNYSFNADGDFTTGNAIYLTFFRNQLTSLRAKTRRPSPNTYGTEDPVLVDTGNLRCAAAAANHYWYSYVGNVLGFPGMTGYVYEATPPNMGANAVWRIGWLDPGWNTQDADVVARMLRDGNWDYQSNSVHWHGVGNAGGTARPLPASLYLSGKPSFFGTSPWPWVDPTGSTKTATLPAKARYDSGKPNVLASSTTTTPTKLNPMPVISRSVPAYASSGTASSANDSSYSSDWTSSGQPAWIAYDLSQVAVASRQQVLVAWYNGAGCSYDFGVLNDECHNTPGPYVLEGNTAAGGGSAPTTGWTVLYTSPDPQNYHHAQHLIASFAGNNWIRLRTLGPNPHNNPGNPNVGINLDVYDASGGVTDSWVFYGDSITMGAWSGNAPEFGRLVQAAKPAYRPAVTGAGIGYMKASDVTSRFPTWLAQTPAKVVGISYGTNDAPVKNPAAYHAAMKSLIDQVLAAGKIPVIPTIPWATAGARDDADIQALNAEIVKLKTEYAGKVLDGPDLYTLFLNRADLLGDGLHPNDTGYGLMRQAWATKMLGVLYP